MRQAIMITAYRDMVQLERLVQCFDDDFEVFIHIDRRCSEDYKPLLHRPHTHVMSRYAVEWGDYHHLLAIVLLMRQAYNYTDIEYFHLITGSDWPAMPINQLKAYCEDHRSVNYVEHFPLPHADWGTEGGLDRIQYWWLRPNRHRTRGARLTRKFIALQRQLGIRRQFSFFGGKLYGGSTYWSVSRHAIGIALEYFDAHSSYLRRFRHTSIAEEICLPTLWSNLSLPMTNNYMRYINWGSDGANPQVLTMKDLNNIINSGAFFARKMQRGISDQLITALNT